jgi:NAD(P)-dependent dehydrogenase (short-subunit alcohol dehydrogenase family)
MDLRERSAIVTGGAGGLGAATVRHLVGLGVYAVVLDLDEPGADRLVADLGDGVGIVLGSVVDENDVGAAIATATARAPLSLVVNVAGGGIAARTLARDGTPHALDAFRKVVELNLIGSFNVTRLTAAAMAENTPDESGERGVVIHTASIAAFDGQIGQVAYAAAKSGLVGMTLPMARDLGAAGIRVNTIAPGLMGTPLMMSAPEEFRANLSKDVIHPRRLGEPEEFARLVEHIATNAYLNGVTIRLDGAIRFPPK